MELETVHLLTLALAAVNGFVGGLVAFYVALVWHRRRESERVNAERLKAARATLSAHTTDVLDREPTSAEALYYLPRLLAGELSEQQLSNLLHVERQAAETAEAQR